MNINYIIATYSGKKSDEKVNEIRPSDVLQKHLGKLKELFENKEKLNIPNYIGQITIVEPKPKGEIYKDYYQKEKWQKICNVPIVYQAYIGNNTNHSYDQFLQGMLANKNFDYHITIEDDYYIHPSNLEFEKDLVNIYRQKFKDNIGYLGALASFHDLKESETGKIWHVSIPEGIISRETLNRLGDSILQKFWNLNMYSQLKFNWIMVQNNIPIDDIADKYEAPFWNSPTNEIWDLSKVKSGKLFFVPIQM